MVTVSEEGDNVVFNVIGLHQLWACRRSISVLRANITSARRESPSLRGWKGWRWPGTSVPGLLIAGTFVGDGKRTFWDVHNPAATVVIELMNEKFDELVIEVESPDTVMKLLSSPPV